jgi:hypothetical protein
MRERCETAGQQLRHVCQVFDIGLVCLAARSNLRFCHTGRELSVARVGCHSIVRTPCCELSPAQASLSEGARGLIKKRTSAPRRRRTCAGRLSNFRVFVGEAALARFGGTSQTRLRKTAAH